MSTNNCEWTRKQCTQSNGKKVYSNWWDAFDNCGDVSSVAIMNQYCGDFQKNKDGYYRITLTENQGKYGSTNLFCSYLYRTSKHNPRLKMEIINGCRLIIIQRQFSMTIGQKSWWVIL